MQLEKRFATMYAVDCLHMWLLLDRLRGHSKKADQLIQEVYDAFWRDVEVQVAREGVSVRRSYWLKQLEKLFYASCQVGRAPALPVELHLP